MGVIEVLFDGLNLNVVMPYAGSGDLFQMLQDSQERGAGFTESEARYWFRQLISGVRHLRKYSTSTWNFLCLHVQFLWESKQPYRYPLFCCFFFTYIDVVCADTRGVTHRDLSPENVMIDEGNSLIIDMGMAIRVPYTDPNSPTKGVTDIAHGTHRRLILPQGACGKLPYSKLL